MSRKCFVDKNIELTEDDEAFLTSLDLKVAIYDENIINQSEIEYLLLHSKLSDEQLLKMPSCKYIGIRARNTDYVNKAIAEKQGAIVKGLTKQHGINAVAEHTFSLILALTKNLVNSHNNVIQDKWREDLGLNYELNNKKLGIIGYGDIGRRVAELGRAFGMEILIAGRKGSHKSSEMTLEDVLKNADVISLHLPSKGNNKYISREQLEIMKQGSILINTARGSVLDYFAVEEEIKRGKFLGVGLDVFDAEPLLQSSLGQYPNIILSPHIAYMTHEALGSMNNELLVNLQEFLK
jgi:phosphoglycerate dehydrogenase-like enzyme